MLWTFYPEWPQAGQTRCETLGAEQFAQTLLLGRKSPDDIRDIDLDVDRVEPLAVSRLATLFGIDQIGEGE